MPYWKLMLKPPGFYHLSLASSLLPSPPISPFACEHPSLTCANLAGIKVRVRGRGGRLSKVPRGTVHPGHGLARKKPASHGRGCRHTAFQHRWCREANGKRAEEDEGNEGKLTVLLVWAERGQTRRLRMRGGAWVLQWWPRGQAVPWVD